MEDIISMWTMLSGRRQIALASTLVASLTLVSIQAVSLSVRPTNAILLLLLLTLLMSETFGFWAGLAWAFVSDLVLVYFFFEPVFKFWAYDTQLRITLGVFLLVSAVAGGVLQERRAPASRPRAATRPQPAAIVPERAVSAAAYPQLETGTELLIDTDRHIVRLNGREISLTPTEFTLLEYLSTNAGRVLSHQAILTSVWGEEYVDDTQILRTYVKQLRAKLGDQPSAPRFIRTESRLGYRFISGVDERVHPI